MSRTYRRKKNQERQWSTSKRWTCEMYLAEDFTWQYRDKDTDEYRRLSARYHSDSGSHDFKEPGPRWFRNLFTNRPLRREADRQIHLYMRNEEYEPQIDTKGKRPYWT